MLGVEEPPSCALASAPVRPIGARACLRAAIARAEGLAFRWRSSMAEHLFCKQAVKGSNPLASSRWGRAREGKTQEPGTAGTRTESAGFEQYFRRVARVVKGSRL